MDPALWFLNGSSVDVDLEQNRGRVRQGDREKERDRARGQQILTRNLEHQSCRCPARSTTVTEMMRWTTRRGGAYIDGARSRGGVYLAVPCASVGQRWLTGGGKEERRPMAREERGDAESQREERDMRERESGGEE